MGESAGSLQNRDALGADRSAQSSGEKAGPDPVIGAGLALLGIFLMGTGGARDAHYVFDVGVVIAVVGAIVFVLFVALSALQQRRALKESGPPPA
jgi:drug/metabolite transporter (DMT)-like permease